MKATIILEKYVTEKGYFKLKTYKIEIIKLKRKKIIKRINKITQNSILNIYTIINHDEKKVEFRDKLFKKIHGKEKYNEVLKKLKENKYI